MLGDKIDPYMQGQSDCIDMLINLYYRGMDDCLDTIVSMIGDAKNVKDLRDKVAEMQMLVKAKKLEALKGDLGVVGKLF